MASEFVRKLIDAGIHFGHRTSGWNPKMGSYIFGTRNLIHIIDIRETVKGILTAKKFLASCVSNGQDVLFVGTKRQARHAVIDAAARTNMHYVSERWLGGTLTNFRTIRSRLRRLEELEAIESEGMAGKYSKKMISTLSREKRKIKRNLEGIRNMTKLPGALVIVDTSREHIAALEAKKLSIPVVGLIDTDSDPDFVDIPIPGNDDAMRGIDLILGSLCDAIEQGKRARPAKTAEQTKGAGAASAPRRSSRVVARAEEGDQAEASSDQAEAEKSEQSDQSSSTVASQQ